MSSSADAAGGESEALRVEFTKPGQKFPTPSPGSGDRVFYESLLQEKPESEMALLWCVEHGTALEGEASEELFQRLQTVRTKKGSKK